MMNFIKTPLEGVWRMEPDVFLDPRGFFMETYNKREFFEQGIAVDFVQDNLSSSVKGTLRGMHYQLGAHAQGKLVRVAKGAVFDAVVDIRRGSATFGRWFGCVLSDENKHCLYVPVGYAHGFLVLSEEAHFIYKCTNYYAPQAQRGILWSDPQIGIAWPVPPDPARLTPKDRDAPLLRDAELD